MSAKPHPIYLMAVLLLGVGTFLLRKHVPQMDLYSFGNRIGSHRPISPVRAFLPRDAGSVSEGCTIGVAAGSATPDGRPLLWKIRDNALQPDNEVSYTTEFGYPFIAVTNAGETEPWMGVNEKGFAILNATAKDLPAEKTGFRNGELMRFALGACATVAEFIDILDSTNLTGRQTQANFAVMDTTGAAAMFETGGKQYWRFDAHDPAVAPDGYIVRTNFSVTGGGTTGRKRYNRAVDLLAALFDGDSLSHYKLLRDHMRDFSDHNSNPLPVPYPQQWSPQTPFGYLYTNVSISRYKSVSAAVIQGTLIHEPARLSTMWTILGQPAASIALPYWPVGAPPALANGDSTAPLCDLANEIKALLFDYPADSNYIDTYKLRDEYDCGLWTVTFPAEDSLLTAANDRLHEWRQNPPNVSEMISAETGFAEYARSVLQRARNRLRALPLTTVLTIANSAPFLDGNGNILENGSLLQLLWAGPDGEIDPPVKNCGSADNGRPAGDDVLIGRMHEVGENELLPGTFSFAIRAWPAGKFGPPAAGDHIYLRAFNSSDLTTAACYGDAQLFPVTNDSGAVYEPALDNGRTAQSLAPALLYFTADGGNKQVTLEWGISRQANCIGFNVERFSPQDKSFREIASYRTHSELRRQGDGHIRSEFSFVDSLCRNGVKYRYRLTGITSREILIHFGIAEATPYPESILSNFTLLPNFPNPFNSSTMIRFSVPGGAEIFNELNISIYNSLGEKVRELFQGKLPAGVHDLPWDGRDDRGAYQASGIYFVYLKAWATASSRKILLVK